MQIPVKNGDADTHLPAQGKSKHSIAWMFLGMGMNRSDEWSTTWGPETLAAAAAWRGD
jgi:hypothetical protein